jgi:hypothetical protein
MRTNYKYLLFAYKHYYPKGGMNDLLCKFCSIEELNSKLKDINLDSEWWDYDYFELVDANNFDYWEYNQFCASCMFIDSEDTKTKVIDWIENCLVNNEKINKKG